MKPVDLSDVIAAADHANDEMTFFYDRATGEIVMVMAEDFSTVEDGRDPDEFPDWQREQIELAGKILSDDSGRFLELPTQFEVDEYRLMEDFARSHPDTNVSTQLTSVIRGRGAFRRFKETIHRLGVANEWYERQSKHLARIAREWCEDHKIPYYVENEQR